MVKNIGKADIPSYITRRDIDLVGIQSCLGNTLGTLDDSDLWVVQALMEIGIFTGKNLSSDTLEYVYYRECLITNGNPLVHDVVAVKFNLGEGKSERYALNKKRTSQTTLELEQFLNEVDFVDFLMETPEFKKYSFTAYSILSDKDNVTATMLWQLIRQMSDLNILDSNNTKAICITASDEISEDIKDVMLPFKDRSTYKEHKVVLENKEFLLSCSYGVTD